MELAKLVFIVSSIIDSVIVEPIGSSENSGEVCSGYFLKKSSSCQEKIPGVSCDGLCISDCIWSPWQDSGECSTNICGEEGTMPMTRFIIQKQQNGGAACKGEMEGMRKCSKECGVALIVGGIQAIAGPKKVELWSPSGTCNRNLKKAAIKRKAATLNWFDGQVITCGGTNEDKAWSSCHTFDFDTHTWNFHSSLREKRWASTSAVLDSGLWLMGSSDLTGRENSEILSPGSTEWVKGPQIMMVGFLSCTARISKTQFVSMGGHNKGAKRFAKMYDSTTDTWVRLPNLNQDRIQFMCLPIHAVKPGHTPVTGVLVVGGQDLAIGGGRPCYTAEFMDFSQVNWDGGADFDVSGLEWKRTGDMVYPHQRGAVVDLGGRYFVMAGLDTKTVEEFDPFTMSWKQGYPDVKFKRDYFPSAISVPAEKFEKCEAKQKTAQANIKKVEIKRVSLEEEWALSENPNSDSKYFKN